MCSSPSRAASRSNSQIQIKQNGDKCCSVSWTAYYNALWLTPLALRAKCFFLDTGESDVSTFGYVFCLLTVPMEHDDVNVSSVLHVASLKLSKGIKVWITKHIALPLETCVCMSQNTPFLKGPRFGPQNTWNCL